MRKGMRVIAFAMAFILTFTTLVSDSSMLSVRAEEVTSESPESSEAIQESSAVKESEDKAVTEEKSSSDIVADKTTTEEKSSQQDTEQVSSEEMSSSEEVASTTEDVTTEEETTEEVTTEEVTTEVEEKTVIIKYEATDGGEVSINEEKVSLTDDAKAQGATANAAEGYEFINWTKGEEVVSTSNTFVPSDLEDATYVANFKMYDAIDFGTKTVAGVDIAIAAPEGAFPKGTTVSIAEVEAKEVVNKIDEATDGVTTEDDLVAFDITFCNTDGEEIQPCVPISVTFNKVELEGETLEVFHMEDTDSKAEQVAESVNTGTIEVAEADAFSIYVVTSNTTAQSVANAYEIAPGESVELEEKNYNRSNAWSVYDGNPRISELTNGTNLITLSNQQNTTVTVTAKSGATVGAYTAVRYKKSSSSSYNYFYIKIVKAKPAISFDINGGSGTKPVAIKGDVGESITLPDQGDITRSDYTLLGWSPNPDINLIDSLKPQTIPIYELGGTYEIKESTTLYAAWAKTNGEEKGLLTIAVRTDGVVPSEPSVQEADYYHYIVQKMSCNLLEYIKPLHTVSGVDGVNKVLQLKFYEFVKGKTGISDSQYIEWYVVKKHLNGSSWGGKEYEWHIDGVVCEKAKVTLKYEQNCTSCIGLCPNGRQYAVGETAIVDEGNKNTLARSGYKFLGWSTDSKATSPTYVAGDHITMNDNITLYAVWKANNSIEFTVKHFVPDESGNYTATAIYTDTKSGTTDSLVLDENYVRIIPGYVYKEDAEKSATIKADGSTVLNIHYVKDSSQWVKLSYDGNTATSQPGGGIKDVSYLKGTEVTLVSVTEMLSKKYFVKDDHTFQGWTSEVGSDLSNAKLVTSITMDADKTVRAVWKKNKSNITVAVDNFTKIYDGTSTPSEAITTITNGTLRNGDSVSATYEDTITDVEEKTTTVAVVIKDAAGNDVTAQYYNVTIAYANSAAKATLQVNPRALEITAGSQTFKYDGKKHSYHEFNITNNTSLADNQKVKSIDYAGSIIAGEPVENVVSNAVIQDGNNIVAAKNYSISYKNGQLAISNEKADLIPLSIQANDDSKAYDGASLSNNGYTISQSDKAVLGKNKDTLTVMVSGSITEVKDNATGNNKITSVVVKHGDIDVTKYYKLTKNDGTLTISKRNITIASESATKEEYDGQPLTNGSYYVVDSANVDEGLAKGQVVVSAEVTGTQTEAGSSDNTIANAVIKSSNASDAVVVTGNYNITYAAGTLLVKEGSKRDITIAVKKDAKEYDGTKLTAQTEVKGSLKGSDKVIVNAIENESITDAGSVISKPTSWKIMRGTTDVTQQYNVIIESGTLTVKPKTVIVKTEGATKPYDGTPLTNHVASYSTEKLLAGAAMAPFAWSGTQTVVGTSDNKVTTAVLVNGKVSTNYEVTYEYGKLTVEKANIAITVKASDASKVYDGTALKANSFEPVTGLVGTDMVNAVVTGSVTDVSDITSGNNVISNIHVWNQGVDVTENYKITPMNGTLTITKRPIEITANGNTAVYSGVALTEEGYTVAAQTADAGLVNNQIITKVVNRGSQTNVGESSNTPTSVTIEAGEKDVSNNYELRAKSGILTITTRKIKLQSLDADKEYDGSALTENDYKFVEENGYYNLVSNHTLSGVNITGSIIYAGTTPNTIAADNVIIKDINDTDVTKNYAVETTPGTLTITNNNKTALSVTATSDSKEYDGTPLVASQVASVEGSLAIDDHIYTTVSGSITDAGDIQSTIANLVIRHGGNSSTTGQDVTDYYNVTKIPGTLTISPKPVTFTAESKEFEYDGTEHVWQKATTDTALVGTHVANVTFTDDSKIILPGKVVANKISSVVIMSDGTDSAVDVTKNYAVQQFVNGKLEVKNTTPTEITITAKGGSKVYDGTPLSNNTVSFDSKLLHNGDRVSAELSNEITDKGEITNTFKSLKIMHGTVDVTNLYNVTPVEEKLNISARPITVTANSKSKEYDGTPLTDSGYAWTELDAVNARGLVEGHKVNATVTGSVLKTTDTAENNNILSDVTILSADNKNVTDNYEITKVNGTLSILDGTKNTITITGATLSKVYDGMPIATADNSYTTTGELKSNDQLMVNVTKTQRTNVGSDAIKFTYKVMNGTENVTDQYNFVTKDGTLEVTRRPVVLTATSVSREYDGTKLSAPTFAVEAYNETNKSGILAGDKITDKTISTAGEITFVGTAPNVIDVTNGKVENAAGNDVTGNYYLKAANGNLTITNNNKILLTVSTEKATQKYNGKQLIPNSYKQDGLLENDVIVADSIHYIGTRTNAGGDGLAEGNVDKNQIRIMNGTTDVTSYYKITCEPADLIITKLPVSITISPSSSTKKYGESDPKFTARVEGLLNDEQDGLGKVSAVRADKDITKVDAGEQIEITASFTQNNNYEVSVTPGILTIENADMDVTVSGYEDKYDGKAHGVTINAPDGATIEYLQEDGSYATKPVTYTDAGTHDVTVKVSKKNYNPVEVTATVKIGKKEVTVVSNSMEKVYGSVDPIFTSTIEGLILNQEMQVSYTRDNGEDVRTEGYVITPSVDTEAYPNYEIRYAEVQGVLEITPKVILLTAVDQSKVYGEADPLFTYEELADDAVVKWNGVADDLGITMLRESGENVGTYTLTPKVGNSNYVAEAVSAQMAITKRPITFTASTAHRDYNGDPLTANSYSISGSGLATVASKDSVKSITVSGSQTEHGSSVNSIGNATIIRAIGDGREEDVTANYSITYVNGELRVHSKKQENGTTTTTTTPTTTPTVPAPTVTPTTIIPEVPAPLAVTPVAPVVTPRAVAVANVTPVAPTEVTPINDEAVAAADKVPTEEKEPELKTITDEDTALAPGESDCWIHWLILLITLLYTVYALVRAYARHKNIKELQDGEESVEVNA